MSAAVHVGLTTLDDQPQLVAMVERYVSELGPMFGLSPRPLIAVVTPIER